MLRALRRVLRPGGHIAFTTIERAAGLSRAQRRRLADPAPRAVGARRPYPDLLASAGFVDIGRRDVTREFLETNDAWFTVTEPVRDRVAEVDGEEAVADRLQKWGEASEVIALGWLRRGMYWGRRP